MAGGDIQDAEESDDHESEPDLSDRHDLEWIALGLRAGLSLMEMNEFQINDLSELVSIQTGAGKRRPRAATQTDIDRYFAG